MKSSTRSPRTCSKPGGKCSSPSCCKGSRMPLHDATWTQWFGLSPNTLINKANAVIDSAVLATLNVEVCWPAVTDDSSAGFDPGIYNGLQSVSSSIRNMNETSRSTHVRSLINLLATDILFQILAHPVFKM